MKTLRLFSILLFSMLLLYSCRKDSSVAPSSNPKIPLKIEDLTVKSTFDWKTTIQYKVTLTSKSNNTVVIVTPSGNVNRKYFLIGNSPFDVTLSVPAYQKTIHLLYNGHDVEMPLNSTNLSYSFNY
jgi:hypothetical protein